MPTRGIYQPIIALYFESGTVLKFDNPEARLAETARLRLHCV